MPNPAHRDDLPMDVVEDLEKKLQELYPGYKVVFAGDQPGGPPLELNDAYKAFQKMADKSLLNGTCIDCGKQMPDYDPQREDWDKAPGWSYYTNTGNGEFMGWQCPECDAEEQDGQPRQINLRQED